jgi:hypothetical protein
MEMRHEKGGPHHQPGPGGGGATTGAAGGSLFHHTPAQAALSYGHRRLKIFPCVPGEKRPHPRLVPPRDGQPGGFYQASCELATISSWWQKEPQANIGLPSQPWPDNPTLWLTVLDLDTKGRPDLQGKARAILSDPLLRRETWVARTPSGGGHVYLLAPKNMGIVNLEDDAGPVGELRGGGYVLAPPSVVNGKGYQWLSPLADDGLPQGRPLVVEDALTWVVALLREFGIAARARGEERRAAYHILAERPAQVGERNVSLFSYACALRRAGLDFEDILRHLQEMNSDPSKVAVPLPQRELEHIASSACRYDAGNGSRPDAPPAEAAQGSQGSSVQTNIFAVGTKLLSPSDLLAAPAAEGLESLPVLGQEGVVIRGWSHLLAAPPKCGKTELLWACAQEWDAQGVRVLWVSEETESIWAERLRRDNTAPAHVRWLIAVGMRTEDILAAIREAAPTFDVVIVDSLRHLFQVDEGDNAAIARTLSLLDEAIGRDKTRIYVHHCRKAPGQHGERTAGGLAFVGGVDRQLELSWDEHDDTRRLLKGVSRICPVPEVLLAWEDGRLKVLGHPKAVELAQVKERVLGVLDWEWRTTAQVIDSLGEPKPSDQQVRTVLRSLALAGAIERDPPISQGEARGRAHRWRLAPGKFSSNGDTISANQTCPAPGQFSSNGNIYSANQTPGDVAPADSPLWGAFEVEEEASPPPQDAGPPPPWAHLPRWAQEVVAEFCELSPDGELRWKGQPPAAVPDNPPPCAACGGPSDYGEEGGSWWCWQHGPVGR